MLQPKKLKHRKWRKGKSLNREVITKGIDIVFGNMGLKSLESSYIKDKQIEACIKEIKRV